MLILDSQLARESTTITLTSLTDSQLLPVDFKLMHSYSMKLHGPPRKIHTQILSELSTEIDLTSQNHSINQLSLMPMVELIERNSFMIDTIAQSSVILILLNL